MIITLIVAIALIVAVFDLSRGHLDDETKQILYYDSGADSIGESASDCESDINDKIAPAAGKTSEDGNAAQQFDDEISDILSQFTSSQAPAAAKSVKTDTKSDNSELELDNVNCRGDDELDIDLYAFDDLDDENNGITGTATSLDQDEVDIQSDPLSEATAKQDVADLFSKFRNSLRS